ncbi:MAG TPA: glycoside hydrolase family 16 protein [Tenuifilum sp.]|nr:glycoside hydrolase family 16 protein [Tenuifilum sp.]HRS44747.1 glycoside hydrolase family 16 protein [Tenuifilum sp.]HRU87092.1 glycoside hydrolase family 16 protein [Tenuifilum sp.]
MAVPSKFKVFTNRLFGAFKDTQQVESKRSALQNEYNEFIEYTESAELKRFRELAQWFKSGEHQRVKAELKKLTYKGSAEFNTEMEFLSLAKSKEVKVYLNKGGEVTPSVSRYLELKSKVESAEFQNRKKYLLSKNKFEQSEVYAKLVEYQRLQNSDKIKWFLSLERDSSKFNEIREWKLEFYDDFDSNAIDHQKWLTKFFWGDALLNKNYSFTTDKQNYTDKNFEVKNSILRIVTRKEKSEGLGWDSKFGFVPKTYDYTSGVINTGHILRLKEGKVEAKIRLSCCPGVTHAFYMVGNTALPEIDIFIKTDIKPNSFTGAYYTQKSNGKISKSISSIGGVKCSQNFYILGVEWNGNYIVWSINGTPYKIEKNLTPDMPMYLVFASSVNSKIDDSKLPAYMEIDWVRCWSPLK